MLLLLSACALMFPGNDDEAEDSEAPPAYEPPPAPATCVMSLGLDACSEHMAYVDWVILDAADRTYDGRAEGDLEEQQLAEVVRGDLELKLDLVLSGTWEWDATGDSHLEEVYEVDCDSSEETFTFNCDFHDR